MWMGAELGCAVSGWAGGSQEPGGSLGVEEQVVAGANKTSQLICPHSLQTLLQVCCSSLPISPLAQPSVGCSRVGELMNGLGFLCDFFKGSVWA